MTRSKDRARSDRKSKGDGAATRAARDDPEGCPACGGTTVARAAFCHHCGAPLGGAPAGNRSRRTVIAIYAVAAVSIVAAAVTSALLTMGGRQSPAAAPAQSMGARPAASVDLSTLSPREAADRLFNRVMSADESGAREEALRFAPMAVQAYARVDSLDADAHYHLAVLHLLLGDMEATRAQIDILKRETPDHLLALVVEHALALRTGDQRAAARLARQFADAVDAELASGRAEYRIHARSIEQFRSTTAAPGPRTTGVIATEVASVDASATTTPSP